MAQGLITRDTTHIHALLRMQRERTDHAAHNCAGNKADYAAHLSGRLNEVAFPWVEFSEDGEL